MILPQAPTKNPETAAEEFCRETRALYYWLQTAIWHPELIKIARRRIHELRDRYHCARGNGFVSRRVSFADRVCAKAAEIMNRNPGDWNAHRAGQQFRRLDAWLLEFEVELYRATTAQGR